MSKLSKENLMTELYVALVIFGALWAGFKSKDHDDWPNT